MRGRELHGGRGGGPPTSPVLRLVMSPVMLWGVTRYTVMFFGLTVLLPATVEASTTTTASTNIIITRSDHERCICFIVLFIFSKNGPAGLELHKVCVHALDSQSDTGYPNGRWLAVKASEN